MKCHVIVVILYFNIATTYCNKTRVDNDVPAEKYFVDYIFNKYGSNGKMSYEGFEHLLDSLGLGQLKFSHKLEEHKSNNGTFQEVHDTLKLHTHSHVERKRRSTEYKEESEEDENAVDQNLFRTESGHCYTPEEMLMIYNLKPNHQLGLSPSNFLHICPILVFQLDQKSCVHAYQGIEAEHLVKTDVYYVWLLAFMSVLIISLVGLVGICLVPFLKRIFFKEILGFLVAVAVGTLCGDALLHLLPQVLQKQDDENPNNVILRASVVFLSMIVFFCLGSRMHSHEKEKHDKSEFAMKSEKGEESGSFLESSHTHTVPKNNISSVAYMVIMGDGLHNLTDGLAIGAAFSGDVIAGFSTAIAVFTHELPHELGDFAVLLSVGMTVRQAVFYNIVSSILSFVGVAIGLLLTNFTYASLWIYAITAGVFLYIALVNLVPELKKSSDNTFSSMFINVAGLLTGAGIMLLIALYEDDLVNLF